MNKKDSGIIHISTSIMLFFLVCIALIFTLKMKMYYQTKTFTDDGLTGANLASATIDIHDELGNKSDVNNFDYEDMYETYVKCLGYNLEATPTDPKGVVLTPLSTRHYVSNITVLKFYVYNKTKEGDITLAKVVDSENTEKGSTGIYYGGSRVTNLTSDQAIAPDGTVLSDRPSTLMVYSQISFDLPSVFGNSNFIGSVIKPIYVTKHHTVDVVSTHNFKVVERRDATCTSAGYEKLECQDEGCDEHYTRPINALGHDMQESVVEGDISCTSGGYRVSKCSRGDYEERIYINALGHDMGPWEVVREATASKNGLEERTCLRCGYKEQREIEMFGKADSFADVKAVSILEYNGTELALVTGNTTSGTIYYKVGENGAWTDKIPTAINAGTYNVYYYIKGNETHNDLGSESKPVGMISSTISKTAVKVSIDPINGLKYNGSAQKLISGITNDGTIYYKIGESGTWSTDIPTATNAGTYDIYYYVVGDSNHNDFGTADHQAGIVQAKISALPMRTSATGCEVSYDETKSYSINVNVEEPTSNYEITYSTTENDESFTTTNPTFTDVGTYTVYYKVSANGYETDGGSAIIKINKIGATGEIEAIKGLKYNDESQKIVQGTVKGGTIYYRIGVNGSWNSSEPSKTNAGTYDVYYYIKGDNNHNNVGSEDDPLGPITTTIEKADPVINITNFNDLVYDGTEQNLVDYETEAGDIQFKIENGTWSSNLPKATDAGTYKVYYYIKENENYKELGSEDNPVGFVESVIKKAEATGSVVAKENLTYNGQEQELIDANTTSGTIYYKIGEDGTWNTDIPTAIEVGSYNIYYYIKGDKNHYDLNSEDNPLGPVTIKIGKGVINGTVEAKNDLVYTGQAQELVIGKTNAGTIYYKLGTDWTTTIPTATEIGTYEVFYYFKGDDNYDSVGSEDNPMSTTVTIKKAQLTEETFSSNDFIYNGTEQVLLTVKHTTEGTVYYKLGDNGAWSENVPSAINAGTYTIYYYIKGNDNYEDLGSEGNPFTLIRTIKKANPTGNVAGHTNITYDGNEHELASGTAEGGTLYYKLGEDGTWSTETPKATEIGSYKIYCYIKGDENHNDSDIKTIDVEILNKQISVVITNLTTTYDGNEHIIKVNVKTPTSGYTIKYATSEDGPYTTDEIKYTDVGTYTIYYEVSADGYDTVRGSGKLKITKADIDFKITVKDLKWTGTAQTLLTCTHNEGTFYYRLGEKGTWSTNIPTASDEGTYTIYYYIKGNDNYNDLGNKTEPGGSVDVKITKKATKTAGVELYDENDNLLASAEESGIDITKAYTSSTYRTDETSPYYVITNRYPTAKKAKVVGIRKINNYAFYFCNMLTTINISDDVTTIGDSAFAACSSLTSITIPDNITSIGNYTFNHCQNLISINIPESIISIGDSAFSWCGFTSISIPTNITSIGNEAFLGCRNLAKITYNQQIYTSKSKLTTSLTSNNVTIGDNIFDITSLK